ncbi:adenylate cyclase [Desulfatiferula olefinivorans]
MEEILLQHKLISISDEFHATESQRNLLDFIIQQAVAGESGQLKGYTIATQVFGRNDNFDQNTDPIVSIQANKLRRAMERYYLTAGINDPLQINIPKGTYVPVFYRRSNSEKTAAAIETSPQAGKSKTAWPTVLVIPFKNLTPNVESNYYGSGLATEISIALCRYQDIRVMMYSDDGTARRTSDIPARFVVSGSIRKETNHIRVNVHMIDNTNHIQIFGESYKITREPSKIIELEEEITHKIALAVGGEHGAVARAMRKDSRATPPHDLSTYEAILKYYEYDRLNTPESFINALEALSKAAENEPDCGQVGTMLGRLHADNITLDFFDTEISMEDAMAYAAKGVLTNPDNQRARTTLAGIKMFAGDTVSARIEIEQALALNPDCLFYLDVIGYILTLLGEWEKGLGILEKALALNPYNHHFVYYAYWLNAFRSQDYDAAYHYALKLSLNGLFWEPLVRAATLGQLGRIEEGRKAARELMALKPDFQSKGRRLIRYYIKFDEILERVVTGLNNVGVVVD